MEAQATDRAYRIGQQKDLMVCPLIIHSTFEEKINEMIRRKKDLAILIVATEESWIDTGAFLPLPGSAAGVPEMGR
ncbi:MAG: hypothetical protein R2825_12505 [Saprospiraceae bacterium]